MNNRFFQGTILFTILPCVCLAHGEQALLLPVGQLGALIAVVTLAFTLKMTAAWRAAFIASALAAGIGFWFIPDLYFVLLDLFGTSAWLWFLIGLFAPIAAALVVYGAFRRMNKPHKTERNRANKPVQRTGAGARR